MAAITRIGEALPQSVDRTYYPRVESARVAAAVGIVFLHVADSLLAARHGPDLGLSMMRDVTLWALPFFVAAAGFLHGKSRAPGSVEWLRHRAWRLIPLYVLWSVVARVWVLLDLGHDSSSVVSLRQLAEESILGWQHLWFIPMLMICAVPVWYVARTPEREQRLRAPLWVLSAVACAGYLILAAVLTPSPTVTYYLYRSPGYWFFFYVSGWVLARGHVPVTKRVLHLEWAAIVAGMALVVAPDLWRWPATLRYVGAGLIALALVRIVTSSHGRVSGSMNVLGRGTMGVYLLHPFVLAGLLVLVDLPASGPRLLAYAIATATFTCVVSFSVVVACRRWAVGRFVFGWRDTRRRKDSVPSSAGGAIVLDLPGARAARSSDTERLDERRPRAA